MREEKSKKQIVDLKSGQVVSVLRRQIESGEILPGSRIPPIRALAVNFNVSVATIQKAVTELANQGLVKTIVGSGVFVRGHDAEVQFPRWMGSGIRKKQIEYAVFASRPCALAIFNQLASEFERSNPDVHIIINAREDDEAFAKSIEEEGIGADVINLLIAPGHSFGRLIRKKYFRPVPEALSSEYLHTAETLSDKFTKPACFGRKLMGMPMLAGVNLLIYNRDLFHKAGIKTPGAVFSFDEIEKAAVEIAKLPGAFGFGFNDFYHLLCWKGLQPYDVDKGEFSFPSGKFAKCLKFLKLLDKRPRALYPDLLSEEMLAAEFSAGKIGIISAFTYNLPPFHGQLDFEYGVALPPMEKQGFAPCGISVNCLSAKCPYPEAGLRWINFLSSIESQKKIAQIHLPVHKEALGAFQDKIDPHGPDAGQIVESCNLLYPDLEGFDEMVSTIFNFEICQFLRGIQGEELTRKRIEDQGRRFFKLKL